MDKVLQQSLKEYEESQKKTNNLINQPEKDKKNYFKGEEIKLSEKKNGKCFLKRYTRK